MLDFGRYPGGCSRVGLVILFVVLGRLPRTGAELFADLGPTTRRCALTVIARNVGDASTPIRLLSVGREMILNARTLGP